MITTISSKGQIVVPAELRRRDGIAPGQKFEIQRIGCGDYRLLRHPPRRNEGLVNWLLACPVKGFFMSVDSDSTDTL
jgi:AbrB family looped-hinge helix DNA binding protein